MPQVSFTVPSGCGIDDAMQLNLSKFNTLIELFDNRKSHEAMDFETNKEWSQVT